jgi:sulfotransferase family protein
MPGLHEKVTLNLRVAKRLAPRRGASLRERLGPLDERLVFVVGSPRSGTTFAAGVLGSLPGFVDLGEVAPLKAAVPELASLEPADAAQRLRRILAIARRAGLVGTVRAVEQTPEVAHLLRAVPIAYPSAKVVHMVRDGRDVVCSLLEKQWLRPQQSRSDDAGVAYGSYARFWVEPDRRAEFESASDARRAAWAWRSYLGAIRASGVPVVEVRYERMAESPESIAAALGQCLDVSPAELAARFAGVHSASVGRWRRDLDDEQLADVTAEAGDLLRELGYT